MSTEAAKQLFWVDSRIELLTTASMCISGTEAVDNYFRDGLGASDVGAAFPRCWSVWAKKSSATRKGQVMMVGSSCPMVNGFIFSLTTGDSTYLSSGDYLGFEAWQSSYYIRLANKWNDTNWHCFHINFNSSTQVDVYMDGVILASGSSTLKLDQVDMSSAYVYCGGSEDWGGQRNFAGLIARLAVWNRTLTSQEIADDFALRCNGAIAPDSLIRYYGGIIDKAGNLVNYINPNDGHLLVKLGDASISNEVM